MIQANRIILLIIYIFIIQAACGVRHREITKREEANLNKQHRNAVCCAKKMRCCVKSPPPPIEIRAVLARCPNRKDDSGSRITRLMNKPVVAESEHSIKSFQGFDEDEPLLQSRVTQCRRKVLITIKLRHSGVVNNKNQYIVIDHVYHPLSERSVRLLNPYVVKLRQEQVSKSFNLKFVDYVNSEAYEKIYNKHDGNFTGCYANKSRSTCGVVKYDGKIIPYSQGFCCSCDAAKNAERQPESVNERNEAIISYSDPAFLLDRVQCPRNYYKEGNEKQNSTEGNCTMTSTQCPKTTTTPNTNSIDLINPQVASKRWQYTTYSGKLQPTATTPTSHKYLKPEAGFKCKRQDNAIPEEVELDSSQLNDYYKRIQKNYHKKDRTSYIKDVKMAHTPVSKRYYDAIKDQFGDTLFSKRLIRKHRQTFPSGIQKRGRQNCADRYTPPGLDPEHYHESAHCLRFSDVWYGIYKLGDPVVEQNVWLNIYERFETERSSDKWREITNQTLYLGNRSPTYEDEVPTISITFTTETLNRTNEYGKLSKKRILIPEGVKHCDAEKYPEMKSGAEEYLVVNPEQIALEGDQCDRIGVGFEAFFKQPLRCGVSRSTCLHSQPKHLWRHDKALERHDKKGCYYLKYHANITKDAILVNETTGEKFLDVEYRAPHVATIDIEIKADFNPIIRQQTTAVITEVYIDSTLEKHTTITIKVINAGLVSNRFMVQLSDFPLEIAHDFSSLKSKFVLISPQNQHIFNLEVCHPFPSDILFCSIEVLNPSHELVALRRIRIQKFDRCICTWHCLCACLASAAGLKCNPMSLEHYRATGFQGSLPIVTYMVHFTLLDDLLSVVFYFALFLLVVMLLMGLLKGIMGLCCYNVGMWGLAVLLDLPKCITKYYEPNLRSKTVVYDQQGWPIHPHTKQRVRNISRSTEFCTNLTFFFIYPLAGCLLIFRRLCCSYYTKNKGPHGTGKEPPEPESVCGSGEPPRSVETQSDKTHTETFSAERYPKTPSTTAIRNKKSIVQKNKVLKKSKVKKVDLISRTDSELSIELKVDKPDTIVATFTVEDIQTAKQKKTKFSKLIKKSSGERSSGKSNANAKICECKTPKVSAKCDEESSVCTKSEKCPRQASNDSPITSVTTTKTMHSPKSNLSKSSKRNTLTTSPLSGSDLSLDTPRHPPYLPPATTCSPQDANVQPTPPKSRSSMKRQTRPKSM